MRADIHAPARPRDPRQPNPTQRIDDYTFDLAMVDYEQDRVTQLIASANPNPTVRSNVNSMANVCGAASTWPGLRRMVVGDTARTG